jgi:hypothetical protein
MDATGTTVVARDVAGIAAFNDSYSGLSRGLSVTSNNVGDTGWTVTIVGYDIDRQQVTQAQAVTANAAAYTTKTFKFVASATPTHGGGGTTTGTLSVGTSDLVGLATRLDNPEDAVIWWAGTLVTSTANGITAADTTNPATSTSGDTRGTVQLSATGPSGTGVSSNATNGTRRLRLSQKLSLRNIMSATPADPTPLSGIMPA